MNVKKLSVKYRMKERGNVLFLILIAVALFAALSYAVTQSTRSGGGDASGETNLISSAQLTQYPAGIRTSLVRMIIGGADVDTLEFNPPVDFANCNAGNDRCVFHPAGGGATYATAPGDLMASGSAGQWYFTAENEIENIGTSTAGAGVASDSTDLIAFLPGITRGVCDAINDELGLPASDLGTTDESDGILFTSAVNMVNTDGSSPTSIGATGGSIGVTQAAYAGQPFGCFTQDANGNGAGAPGYVYYHVLIER